MTAAVASLSRRRLLQVLAVAVAAAPFADLRPLTARADPALPVDAETATLEAWSDTMVPGEKRSATDRAIAGAAAGPGAVQAGAVDMMRYGPVGLAPAVPALAAGLSAEAVRYAAAHALAVDPTVPPSSNSRARAVRCSNGSATNGGTVGSSTSACAAA